MRLFNTNGVDLAKNVSQVAVVTPANKERSNKAHKSDKNDALAVAEAANRPNL